MRLILPILLIISFPAFCQEDEKIMEPIRMIFAGMEKGDSAMVRRAFHPSLTFQSVSKDANGQNQLKGSTLKAFLTAIGTPHAEPYHELIWAPQIQVDGSFAQVWTPYAFYMGKTFHHCGVDAYHLFKDNDGKWKIFNLTDTRWKDGCVVPEEVKAKMK